MIALGVYLIAGAIGAEPPLALFDWNLIALHRGRSEPHRHERGAVPVDAAVAGTVLSSCSRRSEP